jgi:CheY-like chemotaxis protein
MDQTDRWKGPRDGGQEGTMPNHTILIVEDNPLNMELATDVLEAAGFRVIQARSAESGIGSARSRNPDLILMDLALPGVNGLEATRLLKRDPQTRSIPVVIVTAHAMKGDADKAAEAGGAGLLTKPINTRTFHATVAAYLRDAGSGTTP